MLQEGQAAAESGRDTVIGFLETHGRAETAAVAEGLEIGPAPPDRLPRHDDRGDGPARALLQRQPELALIDELAHTNAPGLEHPKRYEDVEDVLAADIDVFSSVNVQHLESLNDQVAELTGVRVRETMPDEVLARADEVVLLDLTPEALIARLREGKVYKPDRVTAALGGFFKVENLQALREVALRQVAEDVEAKRLVRDTLMEREERLFGSAGAADRRAAAGAGPARCAARSRSCGAPGAPPSGSRRASTSSSCATRSREPSASEREQLERLRRLASVLGAALFVETGEDVARVAARVARERGTTYILMGQPHPGRGLGRLREPLPMRLCASCPTWTCACSPTGRWPTRSE